MILASGGGAGVLGQFADRGDQAASGLMAHDNVKRTPQHYLRRGKIVAPTR